MESPSRTRPVLDRLTTERVDLRFAEIDQMATSDIALLMNDEDATVAGAVREQVPAISAAIDAITDRMSRGGRLRYVGAGTPGRLGVVDASECPPTFGTSRDLVQALIAGGGKAFTEAVEGAEDDAAGGAAAVRAAGFTKLDALVAVSASGRTPFVVGALREAAAVGALTVAVSCNAASAISQHAEHSIEVLVGPEVLAGSTRLKAGTAQKLVLNMISTITMVQLGHTYQNRLVDMLVVNDKLHERAVRMVIELADVDEGLARTALGDAGLEIKTAILMLRANLDAADARSLLDAHGGRLRAALASRDTGGRDGVVPAGVG